jgi:hypothetical protein
MDLTVTARDNDCLITGMGVTGTGFSLASSHALPLTLAKGDSLTVSVAFSPDSAGDHAGSVDITSQDTATPSVQAPLSGTGTAAPAPSQDPAPEPDNDPDDDPATQPSPDPDDDQHGGQDDGQDDGQDGAAPAGGGGGGGGGCTAGGTSSLWLALLVPGLLALRRGRGRFRS